MKFYDIKTSVRSHVKKQKVFIREKSLLVKNKAKNLMPLPHFVKISISFLGFVFIFVPIFLGAFGIAYFEIKYHDKFYPGVTVAEVKLGGLTYNQARDYFENKYIEFQKKGISVEVQKLDGKIKDFYIPISSSGLTADNSIEYFSYLDWEQDLKEAYSWGRGFNIFKDIWEQITLIFTRKHFDFSVVIQEEAVNSLLGTELNNFLSKSKSAEFYFLKDKLFVSNEKIGEILDEKELFNILKNKASQLDAKSVSVQTKEDTSVVKKTDLEQYVGFVERFSQNSNFIFKYNGYQWNVSGIKFAKWFTVDFQNGKILTVDLVKLEEYFKENINKYIENPPKDSRFQIENGKLIEIVKGKSGYVIDLNKIESALKDMIKEAQVAQNIEKKNYSVIIETIQVEPKITKDIISKYQIKDLVGEVSTTFYGSSADRAHNIKIGVDTINGMLIAPGEEFSTVNAIGRVTEKEGYRKETVIKQNKTAKEFGGGLCQVATTLFRLALNAGLPITERQNHRFVVHYYDPPGLDAAIYGPHPDLRFVNDTGNYLLLQARVEGQKVIMELYGRKDGRTVEISKPLMYNYVPAPAPNYIYTNELYSGQVKCTEMPHDGLTTSVMYTVNYPNGITKERNFKSFYQPWQKVCLIGTARY